MIKNGKGGGNTKTGLVLRGKQIWLRFCRIKKDIA